MIFNVLVELTLMTQGIQPMVWHQFEDVNPKEQLYFHIIIFTSPSS
jgi:hypothetical protein